MTLVQDLPISKPYMPSEIDRLVASKVGRGMEGWAVGLRILRAVIIRLQPWTLTGW